MSKPRVLFLCTGNACRSQMAEGWLRHLAGKRVEACSAGTDPHGLNPRAVQAMADAGVDISGHASEALDGYLVEGKRPDLVIAVCASAADNCPTVPGAATLAWPFPDPAPGGQDLGGSEAEIMANFHAVRDAIRERLEAWLAGGAPPLELG